MGQLIIAPDMVEVQGPVIFLAGPTQGQRIWRAAAIEMLQAWAPEAHIASPQRPFRHDGDFAERMYNEQVDWETHFLRRSAEEGVILFWLAREQPDEHRCDRSYAQTTRFELAEWKERHMIDGTPLVVGIEAGFTGARYIRRRFAQDCPAVPLLDDMAATCRAAVERLPVRRAARDGILPTSGR